MTGDISARDRTIHGLLTARARLVVPGYQRPYAWSVASIDRLLDDLTDALEENGAEGAAPGGYFLGSIVLGRARDGGELEIVDGQQRLVSLTILLALLRDLGLDDPALAAATAEAVTGHGGAPRVVPRIADAEFLAQFVQSAGATSRLPEWWDRQRQAPGSEPAEAAPAEEGDDDDAFLDRPEAETEERPQAPADTCLAAAEASAPPPAAVEATALTEALSAPAAVIVSDSQLAMLVARERLRSRLATMPARGRGSREALARLVLERTVLVVIEVGDADSAYRVFSVLNTRGERLADTDILKAEVLGAIADEQTRRSCQVIWEDCEAELGRAELESLFSHIRLIGVKRRQRRSVVEEIRHHYRPLAEPEAFIDNVMQPLAAILAQVIACDLRVPGADAAMRQQITRYLTYLSWLPNTSWRPAALAYVHRYGDNASAVLRFLKALDRLAYGLLILKRDEGERIAKYRPVLEAIETDRNLFAVRSSALRLDRRARETILSRLSGGFFGSQGFASVVLRRIDAEHVRGPLPDYSGTTIEHVLPRNPERRGQWMRWFPGDEADPARGIAENCQRLGNLIVLPSAENLAAANKSPTDKWDIYFAASHGSRFGLKEQIRDLRSWTPRVLDAVHERRIARMAHVWGLVPPTQTASTAAEASSNGAHPT